MEGHYSVKQAAEALKVTTKTVRNRIASKELPAVWEDRGKGMSQWWIPMEAVQAATTTLDTVSVTRQISPEEFGQIIQRAVQEAVKQEIKPLQEEMKNVHAELESQFRRQDEKIREALTQKIESKKFWTRL